MTVFYSQTHREPCIEKHERKFESPQYSVPILGRTGADKFEMEHVYFGFFSVTGCTFSVEAQFNEPMNKGVGNARKKLERLAEDADENEFLVIQEYQKYKHRLETNKGDFFINQNRLLEDFRINQQIKREDIIRMREASRQACLDRKRLQDHEKYKKDYFLMFKRRILRQIKDERNAEVDELLRDRRCNALWVQKAMLFLVLRQVYRVF